MHLLLVIHVWHLLLLVLGVGTRRATIATHGLHVSGAIVAAWVHLVADHLLIRHLMLCLVMAAVAHISAS